MLGGTIGFWGAYFLGPRIGKFKKLDEVDKLDLKENLKKDHKEIYESIDEKFRDEVVDYFFNM